jgi:hypothetical protein
MKSALVRLQRTPTMEHPAPYRCRRLAISTTLLSEECGRWRSLVPLVKTWDFGMTPPLPGTGSK